MQRTVKTAKIGKFIEEEHKEGVKHCETQEILKKLWQKNTERAQETVKCGKYLNPKILPSK